MVFSKAESMLALVRRGASGRAAPMSHEELPHEVDVDCVDETLGRREPLVRVRTAHCETAKTARFRGRYACLRILERDNLLRRKAVSEQLDREHALPK